MLTMSVVAMADEVQGITVEYINSGTSDYVQVLSIIGKLRFEVKDQVRHAIIKFRDSQLADEDLGPIADINRISFWVLDEGNTQTDVKEVESENISVTAYPNPTADHLHIVGLQDGQVVKIFSSDGKTIYLGKDSDIDMRGMSNGIYLLQVGKEVVKIVKK